MASPPDDLWAAEFSRMRDDSGHWVNNSIVQSHIYNLIGGSDEHWLPWLFKSHFADVERFDRVLSIGCGDGAHEIEAFRSGKIGYLRAIDASSGAIDTARQRFVDQGIDPGRFDFDVQEGSAFSVEGHYDLVMCISAAHHIWDLDRLFRKVLGAMSPGASFVLLEYVGPNRFQWTDTQIALTNRILNALDPQYRAEGGFDVTRPDFEGMIAYDPSEAVRSDDILPTLGRYFDIELFRPHNGTLLHQLFPALNTSLSNQGRADFDTIVRLTILIETLLIEQKAIPSDFAFIICKAKPVG